MQDDDGGDGRKLSEIDADTRRSVVFLSPRKMKFGKTGILLR